MRNAVIGIALVLAGAAHADSFRADAMRAHMRFLASDLLEGRGTGTRGYDLAAAYVAAQFEAAGIEPGASGSYFQNVRFQRTTALASSKIMITPERGTPVVLAYGEGFVTMGDALAETKTVEGEVVVAGYGVTSPELKHDDYAGLDVRGRIVAYFSGAPERFPGALRAHYSSSLVKLANAASHGAAGVITLSTPADSARAPWPRVIRQSRLGTMYWLEPDGAPHAVRRDISSTVSLSPAGAVALFAGAAKTFAQASIDLEAGTLRGFALPVRASIQLASVHAPAESPNVAGVVRGSDPQLRDEYLVYSAHLDHLGISDPVDGDAINNGAMDNASGIAAMIEIAKAFAKTPARRSIIFLATTAEEKGLRGADYFANNPTVPIEMIVANINIDEVMMLHAVKDVVPLGSEVSDLGDSVAKIASEMNLEISPDPYPEEVYFVRSDQYPFVKQGVPAIYVGMGYKAVDPGIDSKKAQIEWISTRYHTPKDDLSQDLDYSMVSTLARFNYKLGVEVANRTQRPAWTKGNFFGEKFGRK
ncbi:MAG: M20/M25/M40 family metallo-hydrolase [Thermoanaerobaculia bacterium]|nr:M20/M25/M40 family metallo-hydrolase [Thermoanaerobaculia bacterium]